MVHHQAQAALDLLEVKQLRVERRTGRDEVGFHDQLIERSAVEAIFMHQVEHATDVDNANDIVELPNEGRRARVAAAGELVDHIVPVGIQVHALDAVRGTITSSTVTFSKSRIASSMSWCDSGMSTPASRIMARSSSGSLPRPVARAR